jgi:hypothetical protein
MRGGVAAAAVSLALLIAVPSAGAGSKTSMAVSASPKTARAHRVQLKLTLRYQMQCGYPGKGPLVVTFPSALKHPRRFAANAVRLNGKPITAKVDRRKVTVTIPPQTGGPQCGVIGPGSVVLTFTHSARLVNPARAGSYRFAAMHAGHDFTAKLAIKAP